VRRLIIVLAAASLLLAGCGGSSSTSSTSSSTTTISKPIGKPLTKAAYQAKLQQIAKDVGSQLNASSSSSKKPSKKDLAQAKKALNTFVGELEQVNPPPAVAQAHKDLISAMRLLGDELDGIFKKAAAAKTPAEGIAAVFGAPAIQALAKVQQEFKAKGYNLSLNG
jgi:ABC-type phosphate/phosphonate transport system substrate-binding protein